MMLFWPFFFKFQNPWHLTSLKLFTVTFCLVLFVVEELWRIKEEREEAYRVLVGKFEDLELDGRIILEGILKIVVGTGWMKRSNLRIRKSGRLLQTQQWTHRFHKILGVAGLTEEILMSQEWFRPVGFVSFFN